MGPCNGPGGKKHLVKLTLAREEPPSYHRPNLCHWKQHNLDNDVSVTNIENIHHENSNLWAGNNAVKSFYMCTD